MNRQRRPGAACNADSVTFPGSSTLVTLTITSFVPVLLVLSLAMTVIFVSCCRWPRLWNRTLAYNVGRLLVVGRLLEGQRTPPSMSKTVRRRCQQASRRQLLFAPGPPPCTSPPHPSRSRHTSMAPGSWANAEPHQAAAARGHRARDCKHCRAIGKANCLLTRREGEFGLSVGE